jgi:hypothetical protein
MAFLNDDLNKLAERAAKEILRARKAGERLAVAVIAREHRVDRRRVIRRLQGVGSRSSRKPVNYKLSPIQEAALIQYIQTLDKIGVRVHLDQLLNIANVILKHNYIGDGEPNVMSEQWSQRFLDQYLELHKMKQKPIKLIRKLAYNPAILLNWFKRFEALYI